MFPNGEIKGQNPDYNKLARRAYHAQNCKCICGNVLYFVQPHSTICDTCGAMYVIKGRGCPDVRSAMGGELVVNETYLLDPDTVDAALLEKLGTISYEHIFAWAL